MFELLGDELTKALDVATGTGVLTDTPVDKVIQDFLDHNNPLRRNIPRKPGQGESWLFNKKTAQAGHGNKGFVNDTEEPSEASFTRSRVSDFTYKTILEKGKVTQMMQDIGRSYRDALADEMNDTSQLVKDQEEDAIINGSVAVDAKQFEGLRRLKAAGQSVRMADNGAPLTLKKIDELIDVLLGRVNMLVTSKRARRELWSLLQIYQRFIDSIAVRGGFKVTAYGPDAGIYVSQYIPTNQEVGTSGATCSEMYALDTDYVFMGVLRDFRMVPLAKASSQYDAFDIRGSEVLVVSNNAKGLGYLDAITPPEA